MEKIENLFKNEPRIKLTPEQKRDIHILTTELSEIDESSLETTIEQNNVIKTLENGNPLNKIITDTSDSVLGFIACEDRSVAEAYIKYFGTDSTSPINIPLELSSFVENAKKHGYLKLTFHGWNKRLNSILEKYGFEKLRTDSREGLQADFYQKILLPDKTD